MDNTDIDNESHDDNNKMDEEESKANAIDSTEGATHGIESGTSKSGAGIHMENTDTNNESHEDNYKTTEVESKTNAMDSTEGATHGRRSQRIPVPSQRFKDKEFIVVHHLKRKQSSSQSVTDIPRLMNMSDSEKEEPRAKVSKVNIDLKKVETMLKMQSKSKYESNTNMGLPNTIDQSASKTLTRSGQIKKLGIKIKINNKVSDNQEKQQSDIVVLKNNDVNYSLSLAGKGSVNKFINEKDSLSEKNSSPASEKDNSSVTEKDSSSSPEQVLDQNEINFIGMANTVCQSSSIIKSILTEKLNITTIIKTKTDNQADNAAVSENNVLKTHITFAEKDSVNNIIDEKDSLLVPEKFSSSVPEACLSVSEKDHSSVTEKDSVNESSKTCITGNLNHCSSEPEQDITGNECTDEADENNCGHAGANASQNMKYPTLSPDFVMAFHCQDIKVFSNGTMFVFPNTEAKDSFSVSCTMTSNQLQLLSDSSTKKMIGDQLIQAESVLNMSTVLQVPPSLSIMNMNKAMSKMSMLNLLVKSQSKIALLNELVKTQSQQIISLKNKMSKGQTLIHESQVNKISSLNETVKTQFKEICSLNQTVKTQSERLLSFDQTVRCQSEQISFWIEMIKAQSKNPISFKELNVKIQNEICQRQTNTVKEDVKNYQTLTCLSDKNVNIVQINTGKKICVNDDESFSLNADNTVYDDFIAEESIPTNDQVFISPTLCAGKKRKEHQCAVTTGSQLKTEDGKSNKGDEITTNRAFSQAIKEKSASSILKKLLEERRKQRESSDINQQQNTDNQLTYKLSNKRSKITTEQVIQHYLSNKKCDSSVSDCSNSHKKGGNNKQIMAMGNQNSSVSDCSKSHKGGVRNKNIMAMVDNQNTGRYDQSIVDFFASRLRNKEEREENRKRRKVYMNVFDPPKLCECCGVVFKCKKKYYEHVNVVNARFKCGICQLRCKSGRILLKHINGHLKKPKRGQKYSCEDCSSSFQSRHGLRYHTCYGKKKIFKCTKCKAEFPMYSSLLTHRKKKHSPRKDHKCKICGARFTEESFLRRHIPKHFMKDCDQEDSEEIKKSVDMII